MKRKYLIRKVKNFKRVKWPRHLKDLLQCKVLTVSTDQQSDAQLSQYQLIQKLGIWLLNQGNLQIYSHMEV